MGDSGVKIRGTFGSCRGPNCKFNAWLCEFNLCVDCCKKIHITIENKPLEHKRPWEEQQVYAGFKLPLATDNPVSSNLPVHYQDKAKAPEPTDLEETTEDAAGEWTLADKISSINYCY